MLRNELASAPRGRLLGFCLLLVFCRGAGAADDWTYDVLHLKNGAVLKGVIVGESAREIRFRNIRRKPGAPTVVIPAYSFARNEIASVEKLDDQERAALLERIKSLDPRDEAARMDDLELESAAWVTRDGPALQYTSTHFVLLSNARDDIVRRCAVRLEQIYAAYTRHLPPRQESAKPTRIVLFRALVEYHDFLKSQGTDLLNPAFFDARRNQIACASDLQGIGIGLETARKHHAGLLKQLKDDEEKKKKQFRGNVPAPIRNALAAKRKEVQQAEQKNEAIFYAATRQLFETLYHEAFHAYLANFVYPPDQAAVPRWLNEGLAQIFETAIIEAGELRVGHAETARLKRVKEAVRKNQLIPLPELLRSEAKHFLVAHASDQQSSDRYYLNSWALAFFLTFGQKVLGTPALDDYVRALHRGTEPLAAFQDLVRQPLEGFEEEYRGYLTRLRSDGTLATKLGD